MNKTTQGKIGKAIILAVLYAAYGWGTVRFYVEAGSALSPLISIPVLLTGWWFGLLGGTAAGIAAAIGNPVMYMLLGLNPFATETSTSSAIASGVVCLAGGVLAGYIRLACDRAGAAEKSLELSRQKYRDLVENINDIIYTVWKDGILTYISPSITQLTGWKPEEVVGKPFIQFIQPEDRTKLMALFKERLAGHMEPAEYRLLRKDGGFIWIRSSSKPVYQDNQIVGVRGVLSDVTKMKEVETALRENEKRYQDLVENTIDIAYDIACDGRIAYVGPQVAHYGYRPEELIGREFTEYIAPEDRAAVVESFQKTFVSGDTTSLEFRLVKRNGEVFWVEAIGTVRRSPSGEVVGQNGILRDISERKKAEEMLRKSEERYRILSEITSDMTGVYSVGPEGKPVAEWVSGALNRITGYSLEELDAKGDLISIVHPEEREEAAGDLQALIREGKPYVREFRIITKDGRIRWLRDHGRAVRDERGRVVRLYRATQDITEHKNYEERLAHAERLEVVGRLAGGIAHDFNNLIASITGHAELLARQMNHPEGTGRLEQIRKAAQLAAQVTKRLLAFSRQDVVQFTVHDVRELVSETAKILRPIIRENIEIIVEGASEPLRVLADQGQIDHALMNLALNARDAMPHGGRLTFHTRVTTIDGDATPDMTPGRFAVIAVSDTGTGMSKETLSHIFEPFFTTKPVGEGTGLGLSTVYGIVKQHGGHITVESELGKGSTFTIYLPLATAAEEQQPPKMEIGAPKRGAETILLVEDDAMLRDLTREVLEEEGYKVLTAVDGQQAVETARSHTAPVHLLITDVIMPRMGGRQLAETLTAIHPSLKVLFMSGYTDDAVLRKEVSETGVAFLAKPFRPDDLLHKVREALEKPR